MSKFLQAKQKLFDFMGLSNGARSVDPDFDLAALRFVQVIDLMTATKTHATSWMAQLKAFYTTHATCMGLYKDFYSIDTELKSPHPRYQTAMLGEGAHNELLVKTLVQAETKLQITVIKKIDDFLATFAKYKENIKQCENLREQYDHYQGKMLKLQTERQNNITRGFRIKPEDDDRFRRNRDKLSGAQQQYETLHNQVINDLRVIWDTRYTMMDPIFVDLVEVEKVVILSTHVSLSKIQPASLSAAEIQHVPQQPKYVTQPNYLEEINALSTQVAVTGTGVGAVNNAGVAGSVSPRGPMPTPPYGGAASSAGPPPVPARERPMPVPSAAVTAAAPVAAAAASIAQHRARFDSDPPDKPLPSPPPAFNKQPMPAPAPVAPYTAAVVAAVAAGGAGDEEGAPDRTSVAYSDDAADTPGASDVGDSFAGTGTAGTVADADSTAADPFELGEGYLVGDEAKNRLRPGVACEIHTADGSWTPAQVLATSRTTDRVLVSKGSEQEQVPLSRIRVVSSTPIAADDASDASRVTPPSAVTRLGDAMQQKMGRIGMGMASSTAAPPRPVTGSGGSAASAPAPAAAAGGVSPVVGAGGGGGGGVKGAFAMFQQKANDSMKPSPALDINRRRSGSGASSASVGASVAAAAASFGAANSGAQSAGPNRSPMIPPPSAHHPPPPTVPAAADARTLGVTASLAPSAASTVASAFMSGKSEASVPVTLSAGGQQMTVPVTVTRSMVQSAATVAANNAGAIASSPTAQQAFSSAVSQHGGPALSASDVNAISNSAAQAAANPEVRAAAAAAGAQAMQAANNPEVRAGAAAGLAKLRAAAAADGGPKLGPVSPMALFGSSSSAAAAAAGGAGGAVKPPPPPVPPPRDKPKPPPPGNPPPNHANAAINSPDVGAGNPFDFGSE